jgi:hypothetical protein
MKAIFLVSLFISLSTFAQETEDPRCKMVAKLIPPTNELPDEKMIKAIKPCFSDEDYYGLKGKVDYERARICAFHEERTLEGNALGADGVLAMLYANGYGVQKNLDLAIKYACLMGGAPAEIEGRLKHLVNLKTIPEKKPFDVCDDITSGFMQGACRARDAELEKYKRSVKMEKISDSWQPNDKKSFSILLKVAHKFFEECSEKEIDLSGTARAAFIIEEREKLDQNFLSMIEKFEQSKFPPLLRSEPEKDINEIYLLLSKAQFTDTIKFSEIKEVQREWLKYRDQWMHFAKVHYPMMPQQNLLQLLTADRVSQLKNIKDYSTKQ